MDITLAHINPIKRDLEILLLHHERCVAYFQEKQKSEIPLGNQIVNIEHVVGMHKHAIKEIMSILNKINKIGRSTNE